MASITRFARAFKHELQDGSSCEAWLQDADIEVSCRRAGYRWRSRFWTPSLAILTFLRQVMHGNCSCREAVALSLAKAVAQDEGETRADAVSGDPSAYSQARQKLPCEALAELNRHVINTALLPASSERRWCDRRVVVVDGSSVSTPDTEDLQRRYPQPTAQSQGCGFPVIRLVALFCWASGALLELLSDSLHVGELTMFRRIYDRLSRGTVVLGDRYYGSYYDLALLLERGLDGVFRMHARRRVDFRHGHRLGRDDHLLTWDKPKNPPRGVSPETWSAVRETLTVRHARAHVVIPGFRGKDIDIVTTLLDPEDVSAASLAELYRDRWTVEVNLRSLKTTLGMEVLRCKSVEMVRKELLMYGLAYNLIRLLMWQAATLHDVDAHRLSVAGTQQRVNAMLPYIETCRSHRHRQRLVCDLLSRIAADRLPNRPNRAEPRAVKRRPKNYRRLTCPRAQAKEMPYFING